MDPLVALMIIDWDQFSEASIILILAQISFSALIDRQNKEMKSSSLALICMLYCTIHASL